MIDADWVWTVIDPVEPVVFANTDSLVVHPNAPSTDLPYALEQRTEKTQRHGALTNRTEAVIVSMIVKALMVAGVGVHDIGVISPYRAQTRLIRRLISDPELEISTIDKYQGRDKEVIVVSLMRSNPSKKVRVCSDSQDCVAEFSLM